VAPAIHPVIEGFAGDVDATGDVAAGQSQGFCPVGEVDGVDPGGTLLLALGSLGGPATPLRLPWPVGDGWCGRTVPGAGGKSLGIRRRCPLLARRAGMRPLAPP
jgi:hypothetical protein